MHDKAGRSGLWFVFCMFAILTSFAFGADEGETTVLSEALSEALSFFDQGDFEAAIIQLGDHGKRYAAESGIAFYFVAESHYNLALQPQSSQENRIAHLQATIQNLNRAMESGLRETYPEKAEAAVYKRAWANYRLAGLLCDPLASLNQAYQDFDFIAGGLTDRELTTEGDYMAAEVLIRKAIYKQIRLYRSANEGEQVSIARDIRLDLRSAREHLIQVTRSAAASQYLKACAYFQLENNKLVMAKTLSKLSPGIYAGMRDGETGENGREAALRIIESVRFENTIQNLSQAMAVQFQPVLAYEKAYMTVFRYLLTGEKVFEVNVALDSLPKPRFRSEDLFFQANRDQKADIDEQRFIQLSRNEDSFYHEVASIFPEALYWLGWVQYIRSAPESESNFRSFLAGHADDHCDPRIDYLREDAQMRLFYLMFDKNAISPGQLSNLKQELTRFTPSVASIKKERDLLLSLVRVGLQEQAGTIFNNVDEVVELIRYMLPKAALVYGKERVQYLKYLDTLFSITQYQKSEQTKFYQGIVMFLRAEIQPEDQEVLKYYKQAADIMKELEKGNNKYQNEARYIIARAYFDAAKHELRTNEKEDLYRKAKEIFIQLTKEQQSVRSLFYLAEIFVHENNHLAAAECYQAVINATCRHDGAEFWCSSAHAGLRNTRNRGDLTALQGIPVNNVQYPENLNKRDSEEITLEQFGYQKYVMKKMWAQSIDLLIMFGLPQKQLYPANTRLSGSRFAEHQFIDLDAGIQEQIIGLKSGLILNVVLPNDLLTSEQGVLVFYNGKLLSGEQGGYRVESIPLNERAVLEIKNDQCYDYKKTIRFTQPRQMNLTIPLLRKFRFRRIEHTPELENQMLRFPDRLDRNMLFLDKADLSESSVLYQDLSSRLYLRDIVKASDRFLVVNDSAGYLMQYRLDGSLPSETRDTRFPLDFTGTPKKLMTAEGLAIDSSGTLFMTDVDQNLLLVFDSNGRFVRTIGKSQKDSPDSLSQVSLVRPNRVAVAEDLEGISHEGSFIFRPAMLFVTDRMGIHVIDAEGQLLETIPNTEDQKGIYYDIMVTGYAQSSQVYVWNRKKGEVEWFKAEPVSR